MIEEFVKQILKEPSYKTLSKAKLEIIDWIGYAVAGMTRKAECGMKMGLLEAKPAYSFPL